MRKSLIILLLLCSYGCSKKNDAKPANSLIVGKWFATRQIHKVFIAGVLASTTDTVVAKGSAYTQFNPDNTGIDVGGGTAINFAYILSSSSLSITTPATNGSSDPNETGHGTYTVKSLTNSTLDLYWEQDNIPPNERDTFEVIYSK